MDDRQHGGTYDPKIAGRSGTVARDGMTVTWQAQPTTVEFTLRWPSRGWVAIGVNTRSGLPGTHLMMVSIVKGGAIVSDRYIVAAGDHRPVRALGGADHVAVRDGRCDASGCSAVLVVERVPRDRFHVPLRDGQSYHLLMAYSAEPDFDHHSLVRTEVMITLDCQETSATLH
jgi:hypothetical protein